MKLIRLLPLNDMNKENIVRVMKSTFAARRDLVNDSSYLTTAVVRAFPSLKGYQGEIVSFLNEFSFSKNLLMVTLELKVTIVFFFNFKIELEFRMMFPGKENNFLANFEDLLPKLKAVSVAKKLEGCRLYNCGKLSVVCFHYLFFKIMLTAGVESDFNFFPLRDLEWLPHSWQIFAKA